MFKFENLVVYQRALSFISLIYSATKSWPKDEVFGLTSQIRRAAVSIALNIAEGTSRSKNDFAHFLDMSRGSCYEVVTALKIAKNLGYITQGDFKKCYEISIELSKMLSSLKRSVK